MSATSCSLGKDCAVFARRILDNQVVHGMEVWCNSSGRDARVRLNNKDNSA